MARVPQRMRRLYQQVADKLTRAIAVGDYAIGARLPAERELAEVFRVSRPTIREAIIALEMLGLVEVRTGSGVYVVGRPAVSGAGAELDIGPFELMEARRLFEGEACALAATLITDEQLDELEEILGEMIAENHDVRGEKADRAFHIAIAQATCNSAIVGVIENLWDIRDTSPICLRMFETVRARGVRPAIDEHRAILDALRSRDSRAARAAMRMHLSRVIDGLLQATETEVLERARSEIEARRARYALDNDL